MSGVAATSRAGEPQQRSLPELRNLAAPRSHTKRVVGRSSPRYGLSHLEQGQMSLSGDVPGRYA